MVKGITLVHPVASAETFDRLASLLSALGFEAGKGWQDADGPGRGAAFLAPIGNLELVTGRPPAVPPILIEVTHLDAVHAIVERWLIASHPTEAPSSTDNEPRSTDPLLTPIAPTHWNSRLFTVTLSPSTDNEQRSTDNPLTLGFWQSENPLHGKPIAIEGDLSAAGMRYAIVAARWNAVIVDRLLQGALDALLRSGAARADIRIVRVPGAWEIPSAARTLAQLSAPDKPDAIVTLGCLLRGETAHYEAIYTEVARGIGQSQQETGVPHSFGVLTCDTLEQALDRAGLKAGNKGFEAAIAAIEMVSLHRKLAASN